MPLKFTPPNLEGTMRLIGGGKPPPGTGGFRNPLPPPPPGGGLSKLVKFGKFLGIGVGAVADILLNPDPVSDGTIPPWISDVGEQQIIFGECCPFEGGQSPGVSYKLKIEYRHKSIFSLPDTPWSEPRFYETGKTYQGAITEATVIVGGDGDRLIWTVKDTDGERELTYDAKPAGTSTIIDPNYLTLVFYRADGQPDTGGHPPPISITITTEKTWSAARAQLGTLSAEQWQFADRFTKLPDFQLPKGGIGFAPLGQTRTIINSNPQPQSTSDTVTAPPPPASTPDAIPKGNDSKQGISPPPVGIGAPPPATKTVDDNPKPKSGTKTTKEPEPRQTKIDKCAGHCGGGGGTQLSPGSPAANNLIEILNDQLVQNPLLKKIDKTTTLTTEKLGDKINNGGISGALGRLHKSLAFDRWLSLMNTALLFHNAMMLGSSAIDIIVQVFDNVLETIGFKFKDVEGDEIEFSEVVSNSAKSIAQRIIGEKTFTLITNAAIKGNRIYQSAANVLYGVRSILDSMQDIQETIGENVGFIGNALKKDGVVRENSYDWMATNYDNNSRVLNRLEKIRDGADVLEEITSDTKDISEEIEELKDNKEDLDKAITEARETKLTEEADLKDYALSYPQPTEADEEKGTDDD